jgi:sortase (surface protein transpeptidase)
MPFFQKISELTIFQNKKELATIMLVVLLSSVAGVGLAYGIEKIFLQKSNPDLVQESNKSKLADVNLNNKTTQISSSSIASSSSERPKITDVDGRKFTYLLQKSGINAGFIWATDIRDLFQAQPFNQEVTPEIVKNAPPQPQPLDEIVPSPKDCPSTDPTKPASINIKQKKNWFIFEKYGVEAPIQNGSFQDFYISNPATGYIDITKPIQEDPRAIAAGNYESVPVQKLLKEGIVRLPITPAPGQVGNSYIIGHTSNFPQVKSDYNFIFKPFERNSQVGDEFTVWDHFCRKLKFRVFESLAIREEDVDTAYKNFGDKRVVTLQGSILELVNGYLEPTKRWLTRGELVIEKS